MASDFGGFEESSRAFPNDLEHELDNLRLESELTDEGRNFISSLNKSGDYTVCVFNGSGSQGFTYLENQSKEIVLLSRTFVRRSDDDSNDYGSSFVKKDPTKNNVLSLYKLRGLLLVLVNPDQYGSIFIQQLLETEVKPILDNSASVYIFHSEPNSKFKGSYTSDALYRLTSSCTGNAEFTENELRGLQQLPMPNLVEHFSAALLMLCEMESKPCLLVVNYTALSDILPHVPFLKFIRSSSKLTNLLQFFREFPKSPKMNSSVINSNLFV